MRLYTKQQLHNRTNSQDAFTEDNTERHMKRYQRKRTNSLVEESSMRTNAISALATSFTFADKSMWKSNFRRFVDKNKQNFSPKLSLDPVRFRFGS